MEMRFKDFSYVRNVCFSQLPTICSLSYDKKKKEERIDENESTNTLATGVKIVIDNRSFEIKPMNPRDKVKCKPR